MANKPTKEAIPYANDVLGDASTQLFIQQLLMALVVQLGGKAEIPVMSVDATGGYLMNLEVDSVNRQFVLTAHKKH